MKARLVLVPILSASLLLAGSITALAGFGGRIELYSDAGLSQCTLTDTSPGIAEIYVFHRMSELTILDGVAGITFRLGSSPGFTGTWIDDVIPVGFSVVGTSQGGITIGYGCWHDTDTVALHVRYQMQGTSSPCSFVEVLPRPGLPYVVAVTCFLGDELAVDGDRIQVNPDGSCPCEIPVATESTTWGSIKAMYRE